MKISYAFLCHNETDTLQALLSQLIVKRPYEFEIVIVHDVDKQETKDILSDVWLTYHNNYWINIHERPLNNHYSEQKNFMTEQCTGDWIINPDADELFPEYLLGNAHLIIEQNDTECIWIPRINTVEGMTPELAPRFGFQLNEKGWVNWPDPQNRMYKNDYPRIHWEKPVHERVVGYKTHSFLPFDIEMAEHLAIRHHKTIQRQIDQNQKYGKIMGQI